MLWKCAGDGSKRQYNFDYDAVNQLVQVSYSVPDSYYYPYPVANAKSSATKVMVTGAQTKILGTSAYLYTMRILL